MSDERIFICYCTKDGKDAAAALRKSLKARGHLVWQDIIALEGGRDWWSQIESALKSKALQHLVLIVTPGALASHVVRQEIRLARQEGKSISPVKGPGLGDLNKLPRWLGQVYDLSRDEHRRTFMRVLEKPSTQNRVPMMAPDPPADFVQRPLEFEALKNKLLDVKGDSVAITAAVRGAGGYGKTTLAKALAHDPDIEDAYLDGILWVELSEKSENLLSIVSDLIEILSGERPGLENLNSAAAKLGEALGDRRILLVIDDAWREQDLRPFLRGGRNTTRLITTRLDDILPAKAKRQEVDAMAADQALLLLSWELPEDQTAQQTQALSSLTQRLGEWAQLLKLVNGFLCDRVIRNHEPLHQAIAGVNKRLDLRGLTAFDSRNESARTNAIAKTIGVSLDLLDEGERARFAELAVFPEDVDVPLGVVSRLWSETGKLDEVDTEDLLRRLQSLSLLLSLDLDRRTFRFHDTVRSFLQQLAPREALAALHKRLLRALENIDTDDSADASSRRYFYLYRLFHVAGADERSTLQTLLLNPGWMQAKFDALEDPQALVADYEEFGNGELERLIAQILRLTSGICVRDKRQLLPQLCSRLVQYDPAVSFRETARQCIRRPAFLTYRPSLPPPNTEPVKPAGHGGSVYSLSPLPDNRLASGSSDGSIRIWDVRKRKEVVRLVGHGGTVRALAVLLDGRLASGSADNTIRLWDANTGEETSRIEGRWGSVRALAVLPDGRLVSGSDDSSIRFWDTKADKETGKIVGRGGVRSLAVLANGCLAAGSGANDCTVRIWDINTGNELSRLHCDKGAVRGLTQLPDGRIAWGSNDGTLCFWDPKSKTKPTTINDRDVAAVRALAVLPNGNLASGWGDNVKVFDVDSGSQLAILQGHDDWVRALAILPDGSLASGSDDSTIRFWNMMANEELAKIEDPGGSFRAFDILPGGRLASGSSDGSVRLWTIENGSEAAKFEGHTGWVNALASLPEDHLASGSGDRTIRIWNVKTGAEIGRFKGHSGSVRVLVLLADGRLASGSGDGTIRFWDLKAGAERAKFEAFAGAVRALAELPDGRLASGSDDGVIRLWDVKTGIETARLKGHRGALLVLVVLADGHLASGSDDGTIRLWDVTTNSEVAKLTGHGGSVRALLPLPGGRLASASGDSTVRLWDAMCGTELTRLEVGVAASCLAALCHDRFVAGDMLERLHWLEIFD